MNISDIIFSSIQFQNPHDLKTSRSEFEIFPIKLFIHESQRTSKKCLINHIILQMTKDKCDHKFL